MIESWAIKKILRAFEEKDVCSVQSLVLKQCINPNELLQSKGVSFLHLIIGHQSESFAFRITKLFLRWGGDPNVQSSDGVTPTHVAAAWGRNRILHLLLVNGGDPWMQDDEKKNAFNYAFEEREWNTIEMLHRFQQMHSAASSKQDGDPKIERSLERVLLRKGEEIYAYAPERKTTKSMMTQTQNGPASPVQEKIRYFEPNDLDVPRRGDSEKHIGWSKDFYQTSCEVVVHRAANESPDDKPETFVSSLHIDTSPVSVSSEKADPPVTDVRGRLFVELREAVRRRSKLKMTQEQQPTDEPVEEDPSKDAFVAKEVSYLYGINLGESGVLKNMSDFATKAMDEIEVSERTSEKTIDLCASSPDVTSAYVTCEDCATKTRSDVEVLVPQTNSSGSNLYVTPYTSGVVSVPEETSNESFMSVAEEYKYTDQEEGVVLLEKKLVVTPTIRYILNSMKETVSNHLWIVTSFHSARFLTSKFPDTTKSTELNLLSTSPPRFQDEATGEESSGVENESSASSEASTVPSGLSCNSDVLRYELNGLGYHPGPITKTTKRLYLRKLWRLKKAIRAPVPEEDSLQLVHSELLDRTLTSREHFESIPRFARLEEEMIRSFEGWTKRKWRDGTNKTSFNYLLLDPRVSLNLPKRAAGMTGHDSWRCFVSGIFYVGKGKRSRPYAHLHKATDVWEKKSKTAPDEKTERIVEIWREGLGVVCLQVFQNVIPVEALTREAAMIDAIGVSNLKNARAGEYYGVASAWPTRDRIRLGTYLLHKAMLIFINEGERQIKPYDLD